MMTAAARKEDVVIGSSFSGRNMELVKCFKLAREMGVTTIALTQSDTPVAAAADMVELDFHQTAGGWKFCCCSASPQRRAAP